MGQDRNKRYWIEARFLRRASMKRYLGGLAVRQRLDEQRLDAGDWRPRGALCMCEAGEETQEQGDAARHGV